MNNSYQHIAIATAAAMLQIASVRADVITDWNKITVDATKTGGLSSNLATRIGAIEAIAVYDAVNSIRQFGTPYHYSVVASSSASAEAAAAQASHDVLVTYLPSQAAALDAKLVSSLATIPAGADKSAGILVGSAAAADIIALRANDGSAPNTDYAGSTGPGEWRPTPTAFANGINSQWGSVKPFLIPAGNTFRPSPPPALNTTNFTNALIEVKLLGAINSATRTTDQTHVSQFYKQDAELTVNEAARVLSAGHGLTLEENALLFVLVDIAIADVRIAVWDAKYTYKFWRPVTSINASTDGSVTNNYADWQPLLPTPAHPSYPSGHSANVNAGIEILKDFFGNRNTLALNTTTAGEPQRIVQSLNQVEAENGLSRIYGGIHYPFDNVEGQALGNKVAAYVLANGPHLISSSKTAAAELNINLFPGVSVAGNSGHSYRIDVTTTLAPTAWAPLQYITIPTAKSFLVLDLAANGATNRIYRAVEVSNQP